MSTKSILTTTGAILLVTGTLSVTGCIVAEPSRVVTVREESYSPGYVVQTLPSGHTVRRYQNQEYYVAGDVYYRRGPSGYVVVDAPFAPTTQTTTYRAGHTTTTLPVGHTVRRYRGQDYYVADNTWYRPHRRGYVVVNAPL